MTFQESQKPKSSHDFPLVQDTQVKRAIVWVIIQPMFFFFYPSWLPGLQTKTGSVDASGGGKVFSQKVMEAGSEGGGGRGGANWENDDARDERWIGQDRVPVGGPQQRPLVSVEKVGVQVEPGIALVGVVDLLPQLAAAHAGRVGQKGDGHQLLAQLARREVGHVVPAHVQTRLVPLPREHAGDEVGRVGAGDAKHLEEREREQGIRHS